MSFKIIRADEPIIASPVVALIYGEPGIGKTSLGFTAEKPLLEDYDQGVKRCVGRKDYLYVKSWTDAIDFHNSQDFADMNIKTLIIDTVGTLLDNYISAYVIEKDPKNSRGGGEISLNGYGALKTVFTAFVNKMKAMNIDIVFICHSSTQTEGDQKKFIPKVTGGSSDVLLAVCDMVGFYQSTGNKRTLEFNPTDRNVGKNTAEFKTIKVPHYTDEKYKTFLADLIQETKDKMFSMNEQQKEALEKLATFRDEIDEIDDLETLEALRPSIMAMSDSYKFQLIKSYDDKYQKIAFELVDCFSLDTEYNDFIEIANNMPNLIQKIVKTRMVVKGKAKGILYDKSLNMFVAAPPEEKPVTENEPAKSEEVEEKPLTPRQKKALLIKEKIKEKKAIDAKNKILTAEMKTGEQKELISE